MPDRAMSSLNLELDVDVADIKRELYFVICKARNISSKGQQALVVDALENAYHILDHAQVLINNR